MDLAAMVTAEPSAMDAVAAAAVPCASSLAQCPTNGCEDPGTDHALINITKRHMPSNAGKARRLSFPDLTDLQAAAADAVGAGGISLSKADRKRLRKLQITSGKVGEGDYVEVVGFLNGAPNRPGPSGQESVNCRRGGKDRDFHIPLTEKQGDDEHEGIVVEMIPQDRPDGWTVKKLVYLRDNNILVRFRGQLFFDNIHLPNPDPHHPVSGQPARFTIWEVHPVSECAICDTGSDCDPDVAQGWTSLEDFVVPVS
jgi:hypothetical protein